MGSGNENGFFKKIWLALAPALGVTAYVGAAEGATINVTTSGAPVSGKCSLTQALAASVKRTADHPPHR